MGIHSLKKRIVHSISLRLDHLRVMFYSRVDAIEIVPRVPLPCLQSSALSAKIPDNGELTGTNSFMLPFSHFHQASFHFQLFQTASDLCDRTGACDVKGLDGFLDHHELIFWLPG